MGVTKEIVTTGAGDTGVVIDATFPIPDDCAPRDVAERHREEMRVLARRICNDMDTLVEMVKVAVRDKHHLSLGYGENGWVRYITHTFDSQGANLARGDRRDLIKHLAMLRDDQGRGMSNRALAEVAGVSEPTVRADLAKCLTPSERPSARLGTDCVEQNHDPDKRRQTDLPKDAARAATYVKTHARALGTVVTRHADDPKAIDALVQAAMEAWTILDDFIEKYDTTNKK